MPDRRRTRRLTPEERTVDALIAAMLTPEGRSFGLFARQPMWLPWWLPTIKATVEDLDPDVVDGLVYLPMSLPHTYGLYRVAAGIPRRAA